MSSEFEAYVNAEIKRRLNSSLIPPEPQFRNISKFLGTVQSYLSEADENDRIVCLTNSHGIQLRNDVKFWIQKRKESSDDLPNCQAPVLDISHLNLFPNSSDLIEKIRQLPSEWTVIQITKGFTANEVTLMPNDSSETKLLITRFNCGETAGKILPYCVSVDLSCDIEGNIQQEIEKLIKIRRECYKSGNHNKKLLEEFTNSDSALKSFVKEFESAFLREWRCLLSGHIEDSTLEVETRNQVKEIVHNFFLEENHYLKCSEKSLDILYLAALASHTMKDREILKVIKHALAEDNGADIKIKECCLLMENLKLLNLKNSCAVKRARKLPVILIIDNTLEMLPWEMTTILSGQPVCRILSLHLLYALYKYHQKSVVGGYKLIHIDCAYCLLNPGKDLQVCENNIREYLKNGLSWIEAEIGKTPDPEKLVTRLQDYTLYLYCGHGSGVQYLKAGDLKRAFVKGLALLYGCSSNMPKNTGGRTPYQNDTYTYITNGCPCVVGCLYDVSSSDADNACMNMLSSILPMVTRKGSEKMVTEPKETDVLKALNSGKNCCCKYWSASSFVARGMPCKTFVGSAEKEVILKSTS